MDQNTNHSQDVPAWLALVQRQWAEQSPKQREAWAVHQSAVGMREALRAGADTPRNLATQWAHVAMELATPPSPHE